MHYMINFLFNLGKRKSKVFKIHFCNIVSNKRKKYILYKCLFNIVCDKIFINDRICFKGRYVSLNRYFSSILLIVM